MKIIKNMEFIQTKDPIIKKPIIIAAMQDMGKCRQYSYQFHKSIIKDRVI